VTVLAACGGGGDADHRAASAASGSSPRTTAAAPASGIGTAGPQSSSSQTSSSQSSSPHALRVARKPSKLLVVVLENHAPDDVAHDMPALSATGARYGEATSYYALTHPSLPNYLAIAGGTTFGVRDDKGPGKHPLPGRSVFGQAVPGRTTARTYAEGMTEPCQRSNDGRYAARHNPWVYFPAERAACERDDVPAGTPKAGALQADLAGGRMPTFSLLVPDICNDAHDCDLATADRWLASWLKTVEAAPEWRTGGLAVFVTFDEDDHSAGNHITGVLMHPALSGVRVTDRLDHRDLSASAARLLGGAPLRQAAGRPGLLAAFGLA
jgi:phosphatidylinositol-3-phosphatase